jgi:UDP-N-acetylglucosamine 2-epimerase (non-hydrolysing)
MTRITLVVGARPNFIKAAPVFHELSGRHPSWRVRLVHSGQHYGDEMSRRFFDELRLPAADVNLGVGSGTAAEQTAAIMIGLERELCADRPDLVVVFGDVNTTLAAAVTASKLHIPIAHVEAGLRSFDRTMPEEINRIVTDALAQLHFTTEPGAAQNLRAEGIAPERIHFVGNTMIDSLLAHVAAARSLRSAARYGLEPGRYVVVTLHRPSNVDQPERLRAVMEALAELAASTPVIFPVHPRTRERLAREGNTGGWERIRLVEPLGYLEFIALVADAGCVLTDSGGVQEETTILGVPCVTMRSTTERPVTIECGTNILVGIDPCAAMAAVLRAMRETRGDRRTPPLWDGRAAGRIVDVLDAYVAGGATSAANHPRPR